MTTRQTKQIKIECGPQPADPFMPEYHTEETVRRTKLEISAGMAKDGFTEIEFSVDAEGILAITATGPWEEAIAGKIHKVHTALKPSDDPAHWRAVQAKSVTEPPPRPPGPVFSSGLFNRALLTEQEAARFREEGSMTVLRDPETDARVVFYRHPDGRILMDAIRLLNRP